MASNEPTMVLISHTHMGSHMTTNVPVDSGRLAVSPTEAARISGIGRTKLYEALSSGDLVSLRIGRRRLIRLSELEAWLQRLEAASISQG